MHKQIVHNVYNLIEYKIDKIEKNNATNIDNNVINGATAPKNNG